MVELKISRGIVILVAVIAVAVVAVLLVGKTPNAEVPATGFVVANAVAPTPTIVADVLKEEKLDSSPTPTTPTATPAQTPPSPSPTVESTATPVPTPTPAATPTQIAAAPTSTPVSTPTPTATPTPEPVCTLTSKKISVNYYTPEGALYQNLLLAEGDMGMQANEPNGSNITTNVYGITGSCSSSCTPEEGSHADVEFMLNGTVQARQANFMAGDSITFTDGSRVAVEAIAIDCELR